MTLLYPLRLAAVLWTRRRVLDLVRKTAAGMAEIQILGELEVGVGGTETVEVEQPVFQVLTTLRQTNKRFVSLKASADSPISPISTTSTSRSTCDRSLQAQELALSRMCPWDEEWARQERLSLINSNQVAKRFPDIHMDAMREVQYLSKEVFQEALRLLEVHSNSYPGSRREMELDKK
jgi:hypothetical protein